MFLIYMYINIYSRLYMLNICKSIYICICIKLYRYYVESVFYARETCLMLVISRDTPMHVYLALQNEVIN